MRETEFHKVGLLSAKHRGFDWIAHGEILRKDTGEPVKHLKARGENQIVATERLDQAIEKEMTVLGRPGDWGRDATVPGLIRAYLTAKESILAETHKNLPCGPADRFNAEYEGLLRALEVDFGRRVSLLTSEQQRDLMVLTDRELENPTDLWVMDENIARFWLYSLIRDPRPDARQACELRQARAERLLAEVERKERFGETKR